MSRDMSLVTLADEKNTIAFAVKKSMATGGDVPGRTGRLKEPPKSQVDFLCCVCSKKNRRTEATKYCVTCEDYYCEDCLNFHNLMPNIHHHVVVGRTEFKGKGEGKGLPSIPTERCTFHPAKIVDVYCKTHDQVGCAVCMTSTHKDSCEKLYIPDNIDALFDIQKIKRSEEQLHSAMERVEKTVLRRHRCLQDAIKFIDDAGSQLQTYADQLIKIVTEIKQKNSERLDSMRKDFETEFSNQASVMKKEVAAATHVLKKLSQSNTESNNKSQQIACSGLAVMAKKRCDNVSKKNDCPDVKKIVFQPHVPCEELLKTILCFGSLGHFSFIRTGENRSKECSKTIQKVEANVKLHSDRDNCWIFGSCAVEKGPILLADFNNKCLKSLLPLDESVTDHFPLPDSPWSVTLINQNEAAVTIPDQKQVQIIALDKTLTSTRTLQLNFTCRGIAHYNNELYLSDTNTIYVYTLIGRFLRKISPRAKTRAKFFSNIGSLAVSERGQMVFVADWDRGLVAAGSEDGRKLWHYKGDGLESVSGVCVDGRGGLFACGCNSHMILRFSENGEKIGEIVTRADGISWPRSICFAPSTSILVVTQDGDNKNSVAMFVLATKHEVKKK